MFAAVEEFALQNFPQTRAILRSICPFDSTTRLAPNFHHKHIQPPLAGFCAFNNRKQSYLITDRISLSNPPLDMHSVALPSAFELNDPVPLELNEILSVVDLEDPPEAILIVCWRCTT
jgi:hypothetical protein